jgi:hypothetical protein
MSVALAGMAKSALRFTSKRLPSADTFSAPTAGLLVMKKVALGIIINSGTGFLQRQIY